MAINLKARFLAVACIVLVSSLRLVNAVGQAPLSSAASVTPTTTRNSEQGKRKSPPLTRLRRAPAAVSPASHGGSHPPPAAARIAQQADVVATLQKRLERQEKLLALQQQQITKLVATLDDLMNSVKGAREVSSKSAPEHQSLPLGPSHAGTGYGADGGRGGKPTGKAGRWRRDSVPRPLRESPTTDLPGRCSVSLPPPAWCPTTSPAPSPQATSQATPEQTQPYTTRLANLSKEVEGISRGVAGFRFSGDFRLRADGIFRSSNAVAGPEQDARGRYRARLNFDKGVDPQLDVHFQLGSGRFDNALTDDTDFGGGAVRGPIFLTEAWVDYHPNSDLNLRGGKMPEVFQDYTRFIWDEDVRFNGFQESIGKSPDDNPLGITRIDFRAGQYILTNPNIQVLPTAAQCAVASPPAACLYLQAGYKPGENVRAADLFDEGVFVKGKIKPGWSQYLYGNFLSYRNADQIALGSTSTGFPVLANTILGVTLAGPLTGTGTATTMPGGGIYTASHFQIGHLAYRVTKARLEVSQRGIPCVH